MILKVMAGDHVDANVNAWFDKQEQANINPDLTAPIEQLISNLLTTGILQTGKGDVASSMHGIVLDGVNGFLTNQKNNEANESAYLNWILLDEEQLKLVQDGSGFVPFFEMPPPTTAMSIMYYKLMMATA